MKTTKFYTVLSLALIFAATSVFAGNVTNKKEQGNLNSMIRYQVNIVLPGEKPLCNLWLVKIVDQEGREIAPAKGFNANVTSYDFYERGPVNGVRIAVLQKYTYGDHFVCETELFTNPAVLTGKFENGQSYRFDLFPASPRTSKD